MIGVDIEQSKKLNYDGRICLIQLKISKNIFLIDTILIEDHKKLRVFLD